MGVSWVAGVFLVKKAKKEMSQVSSEVQRLGYHDTVSVRMWLAQKVEVPPPSSDPHTDFHVYMSELQSSSAAHRTVFTEQF